MHPLRLSLINYLSPLFFPLITLIGAISFRSHSISFILFLITIALATIGMLFIHQSKHLLFLVPISALVGWMQTDRVMTYYDRFPFQITTPCSVKGVISNKNYSPAARMKHSISLDIESINGQPITPYTIQLATFRRLPGAIGDALLLENIAIKKSNNTDFRWYLMKEGIAASAFINNPQATLEPRPAFSFKRFLFDLREKLFRSFKTALSRPAFALFSSLFLGERASSKYSLEKIQQQCKNWGILHYLARSGLHLVMVFSAYELLLRAIPIPYLLKQLIMLIMGILYYAVSWPSISFIRAFFVFLFYKLCIFTLRPIHATHLLILTCIIILISNPLQLFFLDFQLSFLLTFALGWLNLLKNSPKKGT